MIVRTASSDDEEIQCNYQLESKTRTLVEKLLQADEADYLHDKTGKDSDRDDALDELITGWGNSFLFLKYPSSASGCSEAKRKFSRSLGPEVIQTKIAVRCVNEDFNSDHYKSKWKANVEPGTYRYIVNNGCYRTAKFSATGRSWVTAKRSRKPERGSMSNNEIKHAQKSLKRDLDFRFGQSHDSHSDDIGSSSEGNTVHDEPPRDSSTTAGDDHGPNASPTPRTVYVDVNAKAFHHIHRVESAPNLSSKNSVGGERVRFREDSLLHENAPDCQAPYRISQDPFTTTTTPFLRAESTLRPLEKLTPQQKMIERRASESEKHSSVTQNPQTISIATRNGLNLQHAASNNKNPFSDWAKTDIYNGNVDTGLALLSYLKKDAATSGGDDVKSVTYTSVKKPTTNDMGRILRETSKVLKSSLANGIANNQATAQRKSGRGYKYFGSQYVHSNGLGGFLGSNLTSNVDKAANSVSDQFGNGHALPLPEISGKRIVMETHQRTL